MRNIASWNIKGINHPSKQAEVSSFIRKCHVGFLGILEVEVKKTDCVLLKSGNSIATLHLFKVRGEF